MSMPRVCRAVCRTLFAVVLIITVERALGASSCGYFRDVAADDPHCDAILFATASRWTEGFRVGIGLNTEFRPNQPVRRDEMVKLAVLMVHEVRFGFRLCFPYPSAPQDYELSIDNWASRYVCLAKELGIVSGKSDGLFHPADTVTNFEALKILLETLGFHPSATGLLWQTRYAAEATEIAKLARPDFWWRHPLYFDPWSAAYPITRKQAAAMAHAAFTGYARRVWAAPSTGEWFVQSNWNPKCGAKNYDQLFYDGAIPTCRARWQLQMYHEIGSKNLAAMAYMFDTEKAPAERAVAVAENLIAAASWSATAYDYRGLGLRSVVKVPFDGAKAYAAILLTDLGGGGQVADWISGGIDITVTALEETALYALEPDPKKLSAVTEVLLGTVDIGTHVFGTWETYKAVKKMNSVLIAWQYVERYYRSAADADRVKTSIAGLSRAADLRTTLDALAGQMGYSKNTVWFDDYDTDLVVELVAEAKRQIEGGAQICLDGGCLGQNGKAKESPIGIGIGR